MIRPAPAATGSGSGASSVVIVDGDPLARGALRACLTSEDDFEVVGETAKAAPAIAVLGRERPDVVLVDYGAIARAPCDAIGELVRAAPETACIVLALEEDEEVQMQALRAGADGWLLKSIDLQVLPRVLRGVRNGEAAVTRAFGGRLLKEAARIGHGQMSRFRPVRSSLTQREWEVADLLVEGATTSQVAEALHVSPGTVRTHVKHILRKLGMHSRAEAIRYVERVRHASSV
jgi:two-component system nitrate/nitrite response regulator NarL